MPSPAESQVLEALHPVIDPELGLSIVDLGLVYGVEIDAAGGVTVRFTATTPGCPIVGVMAQGIHRAVGRLPGVTSVAAELVFEPPWTPDRITPEGLRHLQEAEEGWPR